MSQVQRLEPKREQLFPEQRGRTIPPQGEGGYDQCWYALIPAAEIATGQVGRADFLDGHVAVFRGESGQVSVVSPYCRHLGADLCIQGSVEGDSVRCPFHHWRYGLDGVCHTIESGDAPPPGARLFPFPVAEKYGMIWIFNGLDPLYDVPSMDLDGPLATKVSDLFEIRLDPGLQFMQHIDFQHFSTLHDVTVDKLPEVKFLEHRVEWAEPMVTRLVAYPDMPSPHMKAKLYGTCTLLACGEMGNVKTAILFGMTPRPDGWSRGWTIAATPKIGDDEASLAMETQILQQAEKFTHSLIFDDIDVLNGMSFRQDQLSKSDRILGQYLRYLKRYPRAHPSRDFITP